MSYPRPGPGRPKGSKNRLQREVREMVLTALSQVGGVEYLARQASENPVAFLTLLGKLLPRDVDASAKAEVTINWPLPRTALDS